MIPCPVPPHVLEQAVSLAVARGLAGGDRTRAAERIDSFLADILPGGEGIPVHACCEAAEEAPRPGGTREIGEAYWRAAFDGTERKRLDGSVYTPAAVIDEILRAIGDNALFGRTGARICDPALGCGFFLLRLVEARLAAGEDADHVRRWAMDSLFGVDLDPGAVGMARVLLWLALSDSSGEFLPDPAHFVCGDALLGSPFPGSRNGGGDGEMNHPGVDWAAAFPQAAKDGGFDVILGNPPYEVLTNFTRHPERRRLALALRRSGWYCLSLDGQINLYRCFIERGLQLLRPGGTLAMIVPLSLARDAAALALRKRLIAEEGADRWLLFGEDEGVFSGVTQSACIFRALRASGPAPRLSIRSRGVESRLPGIDVDGTGRYIVPELGQGGAELMEWLRANCRGRLDDACEMRVGEVDQTFFRDCLRDTDTGCVLARGAHLSPFHLDIEPKPSRERFLDLELFLRMKKGMADACRERASARRVAQLGIRNLRSRPRLVAAPAPPGVYFGNSLNAYCPAPGISPEYLAGILNSRLLDWLFRLGSGNNNINLHEMRRMPFPTDATPEQQEDVRRGYERCAREAMAGRDTGHARKALDEAVERCYALPPELAAAVDW